MGPKSPALSPMTPEFAKMKHPRLPDNYREHVDRLLPEKRADFGLLVAVFACMALGIAATAAFAYVCISP